MAEPTRVLIVDDEPAVLETLELAFADGPHEAVPVGSADAALARLATERFAAIISDKNLPGMSGTELLRQVRAQDSDIVFVMITGHPSVDNAVDSLGLGADAYVHKPFDLYGLVDKVTALIQQRARRRQIRSLAGAKQHFQKATQALQAASQGKRRFALIIAPDVAEREWLAAQVQRLGLESFFAANEREAEAAVRDGAPKLTVIDARLGWETTRDLVAMVKRRGPEAGTVVVSDERPPLAVVTELINLGVGSLLTRPLDAARFRTGVERVVGD